VAIVKLMIYFPTSPDTTAEVFQPGRAQLRHLLRHAVGLAAEV
jgi:hypothetical protein